MRDAAIQSPTEKWADVGELRMRYLDWGGDGPPVIALHGLASSANWYDLTAPLLREQFRVIVPEPARPWSNDAGQHRLRLAIAIFRRNGPDGPHGHL